MVAQGFGFDPTEEEEAYRRANPRPPTNMEQLAMNDQESRRITELQIDLARWRPVRRNQNQQPSEQGFGSGPSLGERSFADDDPTQYFSQAQLALGDQAPGELHPDQMALEATAMGIDPQRLTRDDFRTSERFGFPQTTDMNRQALNLEESIMTAGSSREERRVDPHQAYIESIADEGRRAILGLDDSARPGHHVAADGLLALGSRPEMPLRDLTANLGGSTGNSRGSTANLGAYICPCNSSGLNLLATRNDGSGSVPQLWKTISSAKVSSIKRWHPFIAVRGWDGILAIKASGVESEQTLGGPNAL
jgi:hypothetical protein